MELLARFGAPARETKVVGLICSGHFFSHFYLLVIPPLFPILREIYGVGFTELGFAVAAFSIASGFTQIPVGFLVDRYGARMILVWGLVAESIAFMLMAAFPFYGALLALMIVAGLSNSVFHPSDYAILNATVHQSRIGRVFSFHTFTGYLGDAVAPATVLLLTALFDWRVAVFLCGVMGALCAAVMWANIDLLNDAQGGAAARAAKPRTAGGKAGLALILSLPILMGMLFFASMSVSGSAVRTFGVSALHELYGGSLGAAGAVISAYLIVSPIGVLAGGLAADKIQRHDLVAVFCIVVIACCVAAIAAFQPPFVVIGALLAVAGFANGFLAPPRDMLIRALTPPDAMGKVFGFVSSGFAVAGIIAPVMYGWLLDHSSARNVFFVSAAVALLTITTVLLTGREGRRIEKT
jgi:FSR family fosmidomycin resistance protein-like MFS transporter